jgi:hypothetical protein
MIDVKSKTLPEQKLREIADALLFLAIARAVMEKQIQDNASPSLFLLVIYIRTYAWLVGQIVEIFKSHSCEKGGC